MGEIENKSILKIFFFIINRVVALHLEPLSLTTLFIFFSCFGTVYRFIYLAENLHILNKLCSI